MRSIILLSILLSSFVLYSQETCPTAQEQVEHDYREPLCEIYGETPPTITVNNGNSSQYPSGWTNEVVFITGKFRINTSFFLIEDCIIQLAPGAEIEVDQSNDLKVLDSYLFSCQEMWHGISVLSKARLDLTNSHIEDAQYAVKGYEAKLLHIYGNTFDRNWVGVRLTHRIGNPAADNWFSYNHFRGNNLKPPFSGQSPSPGGESFAGIWAYKIPSVYLYGFSGVVSNRFSELKNGIIAERSTFYIYSATFESMINDGLIEGYDTGIGILALDDSFVYQTGLGKQASFTFVSCQNAGIYSKSSTII